MATKANARKSIAKSLPPTALKAALNRLDGADTKVLSATKLNVPTYADRLKASFPEVPCGHTPYGQFVIVQIRMAKRMSDGGIILTTGDVQTEHDNTQIAKVIAIGPGAFKNRSDGSDWPEGAWFKVGDFVRCPKYGGDRWHVEYERYEAAKTVNGVDMPEIRENDKVEFVIFKDLDIRSGVEDPLRIKAFF
jgi:co-chaperonin GroES (HSP10)